MSDEINSAQTPVTEPAAEPATTPSEAAAAWRAVVAELDALGDAIGRWAKAAVNDPENKRRLDEFASRLDGFVDDVGTSVKGAADSEVGQSFKEAADKTGEAFKVAGDKISEEVGPKLAGAFKTMSDKLRGAAEKMEERQAAEPAADVPASPDAPEDPDNSTGPGA